MAMTYGTFAQADLAATTLTNVYTVPAATAFVGKVLLANRTNADIAIRVAIAVAGAADDPKQYGTYDEVLRANASGGYKGLALAAGDVLRVRAGAIGVTAQVVGVQIT